MRRVEHARAERGNGPITRRRTIGVGKRRCSKKLRILARSVSLPFLPPSCRNTSLQKGGGGEGGGERERRGTVRREGFFFFLSSSRKGRREEIEVGRGKERRYFDGGFNSFENKFYRRRLLFLINCLNEYNGVSLSLSFSLR